MILGEYLTIPNIEQYWIAVFAISKEQACSYGMIRRIDNVKPAITNSLVLNTSITKLTSQGNLGISTPSSTINLLESVEPGFSWESTQKGILTSLEGGGDPNDFEITIPNKNRQYRITFREKSNNNIPSDNIYLEITGYQSPSDDSNFVLTKFYNDPNSLKSIVIGSGYGWEEGSPIANWTALSNNQKYDKKADWFSASGNSGPDSQGYIEVSGLNYGLNINSGAIEKFPLRIFDIVVEAEDSNGNTSAGNTAYAGTLKQGSETFSSSAPDSSYDIFGAKIEAPSGVFFAQKPATDIGLTYDFIDPYEAGQKNYPYAATAAVFPNGYLQIDLRAAVKADGSPTITEDEVEIFFNNTAGIIYYYTTGDNRIDYIDSKATAVNRAPEFEIDTSKLEAGAEKGVSNQIIKYVEGEDVNESPAKAFGGLITLGDYKGNKADGLAGNVHRGYYLFGEGDSLDSLQIPFPNISQSSVENINLAFGYIDELHVLSSFEEDGETPLFNGINAAKTPKIFAQNNINYSASVLDEGDFVSLTDKGGVYSNLFVNKPRNSIFLNESSITSAGDAALAFRAWGEVKFTDFQKAWDKGGNIGNGIWREITRENPNVDKFVTKNIPSIQFLAKISFKGRLVMIKLIGLAGLIDTSKMSIVLTQNYNVDTSYSIVEKDIEIIFGPLGKERDLHFTFGILVSNE